MLTLNLLFLLVATAQAKVLWLATTPQSPQPYALKKGRGINQGSGTVGNIYPVTGNSSGGAFCILNTNGAGYSGGVGGFPHVHRKTYENFYAFKGRVQLWGQNVDSYKANTSIQTTRILGPGDFGAIPRNTIHTFNLMEPDTTLTGVLVPGGFEEFFFNFGGSFDPAALAKWDVYPQSDFVPRTDVVNGRAGPGNWYDGANALPPNASNPIWVAKNYGPKYISAVGGRYTIINPFVTGVQTDNMFAQGTITMSTPIKDKLLSTGIKSTQPTAFMMEEGQLAVNVEGYDTAHLIEGDVVFIPGNTTFSFDAEADYTKFMYVSGGGNGLDAMIIANATSTNSAFYPAVSTVPIDKRSEQAWRI
jgi:quercetin dioxygenase-like cupin family protein